MKRGAPLRMRLCLAAVMLAIVGTIIYSTPLTAQGFRPSQPGAPNIPQPPNSPQPPGIGNPRMPNFPKAPVFERVWKCSHCGAELGRGDTKPALDKCPVCGTHFINGTSPIETQPPNNPAPPGVNQPTVPSNPPPPSIPASGDAGGGAYTATSPAASGPPLTPGPGAFLIGLAVIAGIVIVSLLGIAGIVVLIIWLCKSPSRPARRRRAYH